MPQENTLLTPAQKLAQEAWHLLQQADQELLQLISELADPELAFDPLPTARQASKHSVATSLKIEELKNLLTSKK